MPYILVNILFFIPIPIAVVYDGFRVASAQTGKKKQTHARRQPIRKRGALHLLFDAHQRRVRRFNARSKSLGLKELEGLLKKVYTGNVGSEQIKNIFNQLDSNSRGKFVTAD